MGIKLNANGRFIVVSIGVLMFSFAMLFQNCSQTTLSTDAEDLYSDSTTGGDSRYRLPAGFNETLNTGVTCSVSVTATAIPVGGNYTYNFTTTGNLPSGYTVYAYGTKNGIPDASEVAVQSFQALSSTHSNPGYIGGTYARYFQMRDSAGRVLCQTNTVTVTLDGPQCLLTTSTPTVREGFLLVLNTTYVSGAPAGAILQFLGTNNGVSIGTQPYGQADLSTYTHIVDSLEAGNEYVRYILVRNPDQSVFCQTNGVRITVLR